MTAKASRTSVARSGWRRCVARMRCPTSGVRRSTCGMRCIVVRMTPCASSTVRRSRPASVTRRLVHDPFSIETISHTVVASPVRGEHIRMMVEETVTVVVGIDVETPSAAMPGHGTIEVS